MQMQAIPGPGRVKRRYEASMQQEMMAITLRLWRITLEIEEDWATVNVRSLKKVSLSILLKLSVKILAGNVIDFWMNSLFCFILRTDPCWKMCKVSSTRCRVLIKLLCMSTMTIACSSSGYLMRKAWYRAIFFWYNHWSWSKREPEKFLYLSENVFSRCSLQPRI